MLNLDKKGSYLKFGGFDPSSIKGELFTFKTPNQKKWALPVNSIKLNGNYLGYFENEIVFRPELKYLYLPTEEFEFFDSNQKMALDKLNQLKSENKIEFDQPCAAIKQQIPNVELLLDIEFIDSDSNQKTITFNLKEMLIDTPDGTCMLPVVRNPPDVKEYSIGSLFLQKHIWVFDNSHRDERN